MTERLYFKAIMAYESAALAIGTFGDREQVTINRKSQEQILSEAWETGIQEGLNDASCRNFATDEEIAAVLHKYDNEANTVLTPSDNDAFIQALEATEPTSELTALLQMHEGVQNKK